MKRNKEQFMSKPSRTEDLLRCLIHVIGRAAIPEEKVREIVGTGVRQVKAFNLCGGALTQSQIVKKCSLNQGNFSRTVTRWIKSGIVFPLGEGREIGLLHVYPLPRKGGDTRARTRRRRGK